MGVVLQSVVTSIDWQAADPGALVLFLSPALGAIFSFVGFLVSVGAAMLALAFVARLHR